MCTNKIGARNQIHKARYTHKSHSHHRVYRISPTMGNTNFSDSVLKLTSHPLKQHQTAWPQSMANLGHNTGLTDLHRKHLKTDEHDFNSKRLTTVRYRSSLSIKKHNPFLVMEQDMTNYSPCIFPLLLC